MSTKNPQEGTNQRSITATLRPPDNRFHSGNMTIVDSDQKYAHICACNARDRMSHNHQRLIHAGWDGTRCIGSISVEVAIRQLTGGGKEKSCRRTIPRERRNTIPNCYRCASCQTEHEENERKRR